MNILSHFKQRGFYLMRDVRAISMFVSMFRESDAASGKD